MASPRYVNSVLRWPSARLRRQQVRQRDRLSWNTGGKPAGLSWDRPTSPGSDTIHRRRTPLRVAGGGGSGGEGRPVDGEGRGALRGFGLVAAAPRPAPTGYACQGP